MTWHVLGAEVAYARGLRLRSCPDNLAWHMLLTCGRESPSTTFQLMIIQSDELSQINNRDKVDLIDRLASFHALRKLWTLN